jgi:hypothetical protein
MEIRQKGKQLHETELLHQCLRVLDAFKSICLGDDDKMKQVANVLASLCCSYTKNLSIQMPSLTRLNESSLWEASHALFYIACTRLVGYFISPYELLYLVKQQAAVKKHSSHLLPRFNINGLISQVRHALQILQMGGDENAIVFLPASLDEDSTDRYLMRLIRLTRSHALQIMQQQQQGPKRTHHHHHHSIPNIDLLENWFRTKKCMQQTAHSIWLKEGTSKEKEYTITTNIGRQVLQQLFLPSNVSKNPTPAKKAVDHIVKMQLGCL